MSEEILQDGSANITCIIVVDSQQCCGSTVWTCSLPVAPVTKNLVVGMVVVMVVVGVSRRKCVDLISPSQILKALRTLTKNVEAEKPTF